jgi:hypothetical protein
MCDIKIKINYSCVGWRGGGGGHGSEFLSQLVMDGHLEWETGYI